MFFCPTRKPLNEQDFATNHQWLNQWNTARFLKNKRQVLKIQSYLIQACRNTSNLAFTIQSVAYCLL